MGKFKDIYTGEHRFFAWFVTFATLLFLVRIFIGPGNTVFHWIDTKKEIARQERQMEMYLREIESMNQDITELQTNRDSLEKFAREQFNFAIPGEDVYVVE